MFGADATRKPSNGKREAFRTFAGGPADALAGVVDAITMPMTMPLSMLQHAAGRHEPFAPFAALAERVVPQPETLRGKATRFGINMAIPVPAATKGVKAMQGVEDVAAAVAKAGRGARPPAVADDVAKAVVKARAPTTTAAAPAPKPAPPIVAYHGSPHAFDRFSMDKIGTGEGAQAYGHGLYFAENEGVAKGYRDQLSARKVDVNTGESQFDALTHPDEAIRRAAQVVDVRGDLDAAIANTEHMRESYPYMAADWDEPLRVMKEWKERGAAINPGTSGHMYQVGINADPAHFLDWDAPLRNQPHARQALEPYRPQIEEWMAKEGTMAKSMDAASGEMAYQVIADALAMGKNDDRLAAEALHQAGLPGIKYLDQGSRGVGEGTRNYVVFNDQIVDIMKRYGVAAPVAAAILAGQMAPDQAQAAEAPQP